MGSTNLGNTLQWVVLPLFRPGFFGSAVETAALDVLLLAYPLGLWLKRYVMKAVASVLFSCVFLFASASGFTQSLGIKGGLNSARLTGFDGNTRLSGHAGFYLNEGIDRRWRFQPELLFSGEGQRYFSEGEERTIALDYIQVPLMFQYYAVPRLYFEAGPQFGLLASARDKGPRGDNYNILQDFTKGQVGVNLGLGVMATSDLGFYGRYSFGLTDVSRFDEFVDQSRVAQIGISYRLR